MNAAATSFPLQTEHDTCRLAERFAKSLEPGDVLLLSGPIGAGKSHFARCLIRSRLGQEIDVPSPTFTLVQTYDDPEFEIWHCDLYRLSHPDEVLELGLQEAFETGVVLVEWPDRLGDAVPANAINLMFEAGEVEHRVTISASRRWLALRGIVDA